ncbi:MAG: ABC transporter ATP-binding protein [Gemmatimonadales bacterium]|nr:ABC transporter ATP-binding protein [Gemmatimonadales bacterium]
MELTLRNITKTYPGGVTALDDLSLTIPRGMFGLLGPNGAGKSTLMRSIATLQEVDSGSITLGDLDIRREPDELRRVLGYLPQDFGLYPNVDAVTMLTHIAALKGLGTAGELKEIVETLLQRTNLWEHRKKKLGGYSGGMRQRFGIAQALLGQPKLIIVDEPTAGLDPEERNRFLNLLSEIGENVIVILSTHIVDDVSEVCSRMAIIDQGRVLTEGEPGEAIETLRGKTWLLEADRADLPRLHEEHTVISMRLAGGRTVIHVFSEGNPGPGFESADPDLQDVYFTTLGGRRQEA